MTRREWLTITATAPLLSAANPDIDRFFDSFLDEWVMTNPEMASSMRIFSGDIQDRLDGQLNDISDEAAHARITRARGGLAELKKFDPATLSPEQKLSAEMLRYQLSDIVSEEEFLIYNLPLNQFGGIQVRFPSLMTDIHPLRNPRDAENYIARLNAAGPKIKQATAIMQDRAKQGVRLPAFISVGPAPSWSPKRTRSFAIPSTRRIEALRTGWPR